MVSGIKNARYLIHVGASDLVRWLLGTPAGTGSTLTRKEMQYLTGKRLSKEDDGKTSYCTNKEKEE